jgi:hypothetical protein
VDHVDNLGLKSLRNGALVLFARENFDALITLDRGILFQHNHSGHDLRVLVLRVPDSTIESLRQKRQAVLDWLELSSLGDCAEI